MTEIYVPVVSSAHVATIDITVGYNHKYFRTTPFVLCVKKTTLDTRVMENYCGVWGVWFRQVFIPTHARYPSLAQAHEAIIANTPLLSVA